MGGRIRDILILRTITDIHNYKLRTPLHSNALYQGVLGLQNTRLHGARVENLIYAHKKSIAFPTPIFKELKSALRYYVQITYTESNPSRHLMLKVRIETHAPY
jgi:hypothetical protein